MLIKLSTRENSKFGLKIQTENRGSKLPILFATLGGDKIPLLISTKKAGNGEVSIPLKFNTFDGFYSISKIVFEVSPYQEFNSSSKVKVETDWDLSRNNSIKSTVLNRDVEPLRLSRTSQIALEVRRKRAWGHRSQVGLEVSIRRTSGFRFRVNFEVKIQRWVKNFFRTIFIIPEAKQSLRSSLVGFNIPFHGQLNFLDFLYYQKAGGHLENLNLVYAIFVSPKSLGYLVNIYYQANATEKILTDFISSRFFNRQFQVADLITWSILQKFHSYREFIIHASIVAKKTLTDRIMLKIPLFTQAITDSVIYKVNQFHVSAKDLVSYLVEEVDFKRVNNYLYHMLLKGDSAQSFEEIRYRVLQERMLRRLNKVILNIAPIVTRDGLVKFEILPEITRANHINLKVGEGRNYQANYGDIILNVNSIYIDPGDPGGVEPPVPDPNGGYVEDRFKPLPESSIFDGTGYYSEKETIRNRNGYFNNYSKIYDGKEDD